MRPRPFSSLSASRFALILMLAASAMGDQASTPSQARTLTIAQVDGGPHYYRQFSHPLPDNPHFFPLSVWGSYAHEKVNLDKDAAMGINTYVWVADNSFMDDIRADGRFHVIQDEGNRTGVGSETKGWLLGDEQDMQQGPSFCPGGISAIANGLPNDGRMMFNGYGKGVLIWETDQEAQCFVNHPDVDIVAADLYWFTDPFDGPGNRFGFKYGDNVRRLRYLDGLDGIRKPVWMDVEVGWPFTETAAQGGRTIAPEEIRSAVWHSIIAGARGIIYFQHSFGGPCGTHHALREEGPCYAAVQTMVKSVNAQIKSLAPVLNSPTVLSGWSQGAGTRTMVKWAVGGQANKKGCKSKRGKKQRRKCKKKAKGRAAASKKPKKRCGSRGKKCRRATPKGDLYVFAGSAGSPVEGRFSLPCVGDTKAAVLGENRSVAVRHGSFSDLFADANAIHIYRLDPVWRCKTTRQAAAVPVALSTGGGRETPLAQSTQVHQGKPSHDVPRVVIAAIAALLVGVLAFFGLRRLTRLTPRRSGRAGGHGNRFGMR